MDDDEPMTFDDVVRLLRTSGVGGFIEVDIGRSPAGDRNTIARFAGSLVEVRDSRFAPDEVDLLVQLDPAHRTPHGAVKLRKATFQRAEAELGDIPVPLVVWQSGLRIDLDLYCGPVSHGSSSPASDDDVSF